MSENNKVIVITGGASGIGRATAIKFAEKRYKVVVADINEEMGQDILNEINSGIGVASFIKTDVTNFADVERAVNLAVEKYGRIDVMFNNAGRGAYAPILEHNPETYDQIIKLNQYGVYYGIYVAARKMVELKIEGVIINTGSASGILATKNLFSYNTAKGAVRLMTQSAAVDLAPYNIRVVAIAPGVVDTPITQKYKEAGLEKFYADKQASGEWIKPEDIANTVYLLSLKEAKAINGSVVQVDDGYVSFK